MNSEIILGLRIKRADTGEEFDVWGYTTFKNVTDDGKVYYCGGASFPESIVLKEYKTSRTAEQLYQLIQSAEQIEFKFNVGATLYCISENIKHKKPCRIVSGEVIGRSSREHFSQGKLVRTVYYELGARTQFCSNRCFGDEAEAHAKCDELNEWHNRRVMDKL